MGESACSGGGGHVGLEGGGLEPGKGGLHLVLHGADGGAEEGGHGVCPGHLLEDGDEETDLDLGGVLEKAVEGSGALGLGEDLEPWRR